MFSDHNFKIERRHPLEVGKGDGNCEAWEGAGRKEIAYLKRKRQLTRTDAAWDMNQLPNADCADKALPCLVAPKTDRNLRETHLLWASGRALHSEMTPLQQPPGRMPLVWSQNLQELSSTSGLSAACGICSPLPDIHFSWKRYPLVLKTVVLLGWESTRPKSWGQGKPFSASLLPAGETSTALSPPPEHFNRDVSLLTPEWGLAMGEEGAGSFMPQPASLLPCPTVEAALALACTWQKSRAPLTQNPPKVLTKVLALSQVPRRQRAGETLSISLHTTT